jgi:hypothetical protein
MINDDPNWRVKRVSKALDAFWVIHRYAPTARELTAFMKLQAWAPIFADLQRAADLGLICACRITQINGQRHYTPWWVINAIGEAANGGCAAEATQYLP